MQQQRENISGKALFQDVVIFGVLIVIGFLISILLGLVLLGLAGFVWAFIVSRPERKKKSIKGVVIVTTALILLHLATGEPATNFDYFVIFFCAPVFGFLLFTPIADTRHKKNGLPPLSDDFEIYMRKRG